MNRLDIREEQWHRYTPLGIMLVIQRVTSLKFIIYNFHKVQLVLRVSFISIIRRKCYQLLIENLHCQESIVLIASIN